MTGSLEAPTQARPRARPARRLCRYVAVDGGDGAHLLAALAGADPRLHPAGSPRHADLLIVVEPVARRLASALAEIARALPRPARALVVGEPGPDRFPHADLIRVEELLPGARRIPHHALTAVVDAALDPARADGLTVAGAPPLDATMLPLPSKQEREIATELAVLSLGPVQPFITGPLRLLLACDGEQVLTVRVEGGYARRGIDEAMTGVTWREAADLAGALDPPAPVTGRLAYVRAMERLQGHEPPAPVTACRDAALALERARNHLWWLVRFVGLLDCAVVATPARGVAAALDEALPEVWDAPPEAWISPGGGVPPARTGAAAALARIAQDAATLAERVARDRLLGLRTRGVGVLDAARLRAAEVSGPVRRANERDAGDADARLRTRLAAAADDLRGAAALLTAGAEPHRAPVWDVPAGEACVAVEGPRGRIGVRLTSEGGNGPARVVWQRPSAALLTLVPEALAGQKLADAETILASLDLSMAEADG